MKVPLYSRLYSDDPTSWNGVFHCALHDKGWRDSLEGWATAMKASWRADPLGSRRLQSPLMSRPTQHSEGQDRSGYLPRKRKAPCGAFEVYHAASWG